MVFEGNPTADDIAIAVVAACDETADDPVAVAYERVPGARARHYALHALARTFPRTDKSNLALCVGCPGKGHYFWNNSVNQVVKPRKGGRSGYVASWFNQAVLDLVVRKIEAAKTARAVGAKVQRQAPAASPRPTRMTPLESAREAAGIVNQGSRFSGLGTREYDVPPIQDKSHLQRMLAEAAANTAREQEKMKGRS